MRSVTGVRWCSRRGLVEALDGIFGQFQPPFDAFDTADNGIDGFAVATVEPAALMAAFQLPPELQPFAINLLR
jgi:hypothetical protein